jgi:V/A-type H+-transporting ATPase subunit K
MAYFVQTGVGWAVVGAIACVMLGGIGSAHGIKISASQAAGVMSEKPELFGRLLVIMALPGTQGFYSFIIAVLIALRTGVIAGEAMVTPVAGLSLLAVGICAGAVEWRSAIYQGQTSAAAINLVAKRPEAAGRAILLPALVETYAVVALLGAILFTLWVTPPGALKLPDLDLNRPAATQTQSK